jgi:hypothetical protein
MWSSKNCRNLSIHSFALSCFQKKTIETKIVPLAEGVHLLSRISDAPSKWSLLFFHGRGYIVDGWIPAAHHSFPLQHPFCENPKVQASSKTSTVEAQLYKLWNPYAIVPAKARCRRSDSIAMHVHVYSRSSLEVYPSSLAISIYFYLHQRVPLSWIKFCYIIGCRSLSLVHKMIDRLLFSVDIRHTFLRHRGTDTSLFGVFINRSFLGSF